MRGEAKIGPMRPGKKARMKMPRRRGKWYAFVAWVFVLVGI